MQFEDGWCSWCFEVAAPRSSCIAQSNARNSSHRKGMLAFDGFDVGMSASALRSLILTSVLLLLGDDADDLQPLSWCVKRVLFYQIKHKNKDKLRTIRDGDVFP